MDHIVKNITELKSAIDAAVSGDRILLEGGEYGDLQLRNKKFASVVTIKPKSLRNPVIFGGYDLGGMGKLTFKNVTFKPKFDGGPEWVTYGAVVSSENIGFYDCDFFGPDAEDGFGTGIGISLQKTKNVTIRRSKIHGWHRGVCLVEYVYGLKFQLNDIYNIRSDGMDIPGAQSALIEKNTFRDFRAKPGSGDHCDVFQCWSTNQDVPMKDVTVRFNIMDIGSGSWSQSIFMRNEKFDQGVDLNFQYKNVKIHDNWIRNNHTHGITVGAVKGLQIYNNALIVGTMNMENKVNADDVLYWHNNPEDQIFFPRIHLAPGSTNVLVSNNTLYNTFKADPYGPFDFGTAADSAGWVLTNNTVKPGSEAPARPVYK